MDAYCPRASIGDLAKSQKTFQMAHLLYHPLDNSSEHSPFDRAALSVARDSEALIVSPYIGVSYLERILDVADEWRLVSDIEAWLSSLSQVARPRAWEFIRCNLDRIHHCANIHAKVIVGYRLAMMGSANLTSKGVLGRTEMGILLDEPRLVTELRSWFEGLWAQTASPIVDEANALVAWLDEEAKQTPIRRRKVSLTSKSQEVRAKLIQTASARLKPSSGPVPVLPPNLTNKPTVLPERVTTVVPVALDLAAVAGELVRQDEARVRNLAERVQAAIERMASSGFTLGEMMGYIGEASYREVYFLVLQYCANHPRSVFIEETVNRLILEAGGRFVQSTAEHLSTALMPYDQYLLWIVEQLDIHEPRILALEEEGERLTGLAARHQVLLISELLDCGLLILEDLPGSLPHYQLADDFEWHGRFKFFPRSAAAWNTKMAQDWRKRSAPVVEMDHDFEDDQPLSAAEEDAKSWESVAKALDNIAKARKKAEEREKNDLDRLYSIFIPWLYNHPDKIWTNKQKGLPELIGPLISLPKSQIHKVLFSPHGPQCWSLVTVPEMPQKALRLSSTLTVEILNGFPRAQAALKKVQIE